MTYIPNFRSNVLYVSKSGNNNSAERGFPHKAYADPWSALASAREGDTIHVFPGIYTIGNLGSGADFEWDEVDEEDFNLTKGVSEINYYFENGSIIKIIDSSGIFGSDWTRGLFDDNDDGTKRLTIKGHLEIILEDFITVFSQRTITSHFNISIKGLRSSGPNGYLGAVGISAGDLIYQADYVNGRDVRAYILHPAGTSSKSIHIRNLNITTPVDGVLQDFVIGNTLNSEPAKYATCNGSINIKVDNYRTAFSFAGGSSILNSLGGMQEGVELDGVNLNLEIGSYVDIVNTTGIGGSTLIDIFDKFPNGIKNSNINININNLNTGNKLFSKGNTTVDHDNNLFTFNIKNAVFRSNTMAYFANDTNSTFTNNTMLINIENCVLENDVGLDFNGGAGTNTGSLIILTGRYKQEAAGKEIAQLEPVWDCYIKDCDLINDATVDVVSATAATNVLIKNVISNTVVEDADVTEVGETIIRNANYK